MPDIKTKLKLLAFDLDDTLAPSKSEIPQIIVTQLTKLLQKYQICIISGGDYKQFEKQIINVFQKATTINLENLHLMPTCGTSYYTFRHNKWNKEYIEVLGEQESKEAIKAIEECAKTLNYWHSNPWGEIIEHRGSQITFSALGQEAPLDEKHKWDIDGTKRAKLKSAVEKLIPNLEVRSGGSTSIDITRKGTDKSYGMKKLIEKTGLDKGNILFFGDRLSSEGNDYPVYKFGIPSIAVNNWQETSEMLSKIIEDDRSILDNILK